MKTENSGDKCRSNGMVHTSQLPENPYQNQVVNTGINGQCIRPMPVRTDRDIKHTNSRQKQMADFQRQYQNQNQSSLNEWMFQNGNGAINTCTCFNCNE